MMRTKLFTFILLAMFCCVQATKAQFAGPASIPLNTPIMIAAWTFDNLAASPNTPRVIAAEHGFQTTAAIYMDSTNGSSNWLQATELNSFAGTTLNDFRSTPVSGMSLCPLGGGTGNPSNGKSIVFKFSMTGMEDAQISFATRGTSTGFTTHQWAYSTNGTTFTDFGTNTANITATWLTRTLNMDTISAIDGAAIVYLRLTLTGASGTGAGNNRLENFIIQATPMAQPPVKLNIASINDGEPITANVPFNITVRALDNSNIPQNVANATGISLSLLSGSGTLGGTLTATIPVGANSHTFSNITIGSVGTAYSIKVSRTSGDTLLPDSTAQFAAQQKFNPGDIAIIGVKATNPDTFAFVNFTAIPAGTVLWFNDNELDTNGVFNSGESVWTFTAPASIPAGTVTGWNGTAGNGWNGILNLATTGEQIFVYQYGAPYNYIYAINWGNAGWLTSGNPTGANSYLPITLTNGVNAIHLGTGADHYYNITVNNGNPAAIFDSIVNVSKWAAGTTFPAWVFNLGPQPPMVTSDSINGVTFNAATAFGNVTFDGNSAITSRGICYGTTQNPTAAGTKVIVSGTSGAFSANLTNLLSNQQYYIRAFAINAVDTAYGAQLSFTTLPPPVIATLTTTAISAIATTSAISGGNITSDGGATVTARGVCWATTANPTTANSFTTDGSGTGSFSSTINGLSSNTTYYVRAYATNYAGTAYGNQLSFTTAASAVAPIVVFDTVTSIIDTSAIMHADVISDGGAVVTSRGFLYGTTALPGFANSIATAGSGTGIYSATINGLTPATTYYVRAFAINSVDTAYSSVSTFTTFQFTVPVVSTDSVSQIQVSQATAHAAVGSDGGKPVFLQGFCYSTNQNPTLNDSVVYAVGSTTPFDAVLTGLTGGTTYYVRAFATNQVGTGYGSQLSFSTLPPPTVLVPGDLVFLAYSTSTTPDRFAFLLLNSVNPGTQISFTDNAWNGAANPAVLLTNENTATWTAPATGLTAGSVILVSGPNVTGGGTLSGQLNGLATGGEQILAYQGTAAAPQFLAGVSSTAWLTTGTVNNNSSYLPDTLQLGFSAIGFSTNASNGRYNNTLTWGTVPQLRSAITDTANWVRSNFAQTWPTFSFTIGAYVDTFPPIATAAITIDSVTVKVTFDEAISAASAQNTANYTGLGTITSATLNATMDTVTLLLTTPLTAGVADTLYVAGIADTSNNVMTQTYTFSVYWHPTATQVLSPGDIAFTAYRHDADDAIRFLALVDIDPFVEISFTDNAWRGNLTPPSLATNENTLVWTASLMGLPAGSQIHIVSPATGAAIVTGGGTATGLLNGLSAFGDQVLAYQGAAQNPSFIAAYSSAGWMTTGTPITTNSYLPDVLANGITALGFPFDRDNGIYNCSVVSAKKTELLLAINDSANWIRNDLPDTLNWQYCTFTILPGASMPIVNTVSVNSITQTDALAEGNVFLDGGAVVTSRGICWGTSPTPTIANDTVMAVGTTGAFSATISGLTHNTTYYVRAFATNSEGTSYGNQLSFKTLLDGVDEFESVIALKLFPNPAEDALFVSFATIDKLQATIVDLQGRFIMGSMLSQGMNTLNIQSLAPGMYYVRLEDVSSGKTIHKKLLKR